MLASHLASVKRALILWCSLFLSVAVFAQLEEWNDQARKLMRSEPDKAYLYADSSLVYASQRVLPARKAEAHFLIGEIHRHQANFSAALDAYLKAQRIYENLKDDLAVAHTQLSLGIIYHYLQQTELAFQQVRFSIGTFERLNDPAALAEAYGQLGHLYEKGLNPDSALLFQHRAFALCDSLHDQKGLSEIAEHLGSIYEDLEAYDSAFSYFALAYSIMKSRGDGVGQASVMNNLGDIYRKKGNADSALFWTRQALFKADELDLKYQESSALRDMAKIHAGIGNYDSAFHYQELSKDLFERMYSRESNRQIALFETMFNVERKNNAIRELELEQKRESTRRWWFIFSGVLLVVVAVVIFSRQRLSIQKNKQIIKQGKLVHEKALENERLSRERLEIELRHKKLEEEHLNLELESQQKALASRMLQLTEKNKLLEEVRGVLKEIDPELNEQTRKKWKELARQIDYNFNHDKHWEEFRRSFEQIHQGFFQELKKHHAKLTGNDLRICALMRINLPSDDIAALLGISQDSLRVARYRLRKKLGLQQGDNLRTFILSI